MSERVQDLADGARLNHPVPLFLERVVDRENFTAHDLSGIVPTGTLSSVQIQLMTSWQTFSPTREYTEAVELPYEHCK